MTKGGRTIRSGFGYGGSKPTRIAKSQKPTGFAGHSRVRHPERRSTWWKNRKKGGGVKDPKPSDQLAAITNKDFENYEKDFLPVEEALVKEISGDSAERKAALEARTAAERTFLRNRESLERERSRTGAGGMSSTVSREASAQQGLARSRVAVGASNQGYRHQAAEDSATRTNLVMAGQGLRGQALQGLGAAATMDNQRTAAGNAMKAQQKQSMMGNIGTGAAMGLTFGLPGAAIGAGVGFLASMF